MWNRPRESSRPDLSLQEPWSAPYSSRLTYQTESYIECQRDLIRPCRKASVPTGWVQVFSLINFGGLQGRELRSALSAG